MSYELLKQKRNKSSIIPIEEIYTDLDINVNDPYEPNVGYRFDSPRRWSNDNSKNKSIGIRDLHLIPSSGDIRCRFLIYGNVQMSGTKYTWGDNSGEIFEPEYTETTDVEVDDVANFYCVSDAYNIQITPSNGFEEIATNMIDFVNGAHWKSTRFKNNKNHYETYKPSHEDTNRGNLYLKRELDAVNKKDVDTILSKVINRRYLKLPLSFYYHFDSNNSNFECKNNIYLHWVLMTGYTTPYGDNDTQNNVNIEALKINNHQYLSPDSFDATTQINNETNVYLIEEEPFLESSELLNVMMSLLLKLYMICLIKKCLI